MYTNDNYALRCSILVTTYYSGQGGIAARNSNSMYFMLTNNYKTTNCVNLLKAIVDHRDLITISIITSKQLRYNIDIYVRKLNFKCILLKQPGRTTFLRGW